jgi:APA family basic amino acid/polyamine antiporter
MILSLAVVTICTVVLLRDLQLGSAFQNGSTILKISLIAIIVAAGFWVKSSQPVSFLPAKGDGALIMSAPFAVSLYWVMYAYSGWNASTYIVGELRNPSRTVLVSVGLGTIAVTALYVAINAVFLRTTPMAEMAGKQQVAVIAGSHIFGAPGSKMMGLFICLGLISTVSGMMWIGPRITAAMGEDLRALGWFGRRNAHGVPTNAILAQFAIVVGFLLTATFESAVNYVQFSLTLCSTLTVLGVFVLRWRQPKLPRPYRTWGYPVTPLVFLAISVWMLEHLLADSSTRAPSLWGLATMALGLIVYFLSPKTKSARPS